MVLPRIKGYFLLKIGKYFDEKPTVVVFSMDKTNINPTRPSLS